MAQSVMQPLTGIDPRCQLAQRLVELLNGALGVDHRQTVRDTGEDAGTRPAQLLDAPDALLDRRAGQQRQHAGQRDIAEAGGRVVKVLSRQENQSQHDGYAGHDRGAGRR